ncbi:MAG: winged helix-turn-helix domain-containing protein [Chloroflexi bacterium]|nr:winged helix-turn-helix domain-containing protein [Chloroflexota bacterium]
MDGNEVNVAFDILLEEIEMVANGLNEAGSEAFKSGQYDRAREVIEMATRLSDFRGRVKTLQQEWARLFAARIPSRLAKRIRRRPVERLSRGLRTGEDAYRLPILETLVELGGRCSVGEVLDRVAVKMKGIFNEYDYQPLPSSPKTARWRNSAQWCRNTLVRETLMKADSPSGIWEISEAGRKLISQHTKMP